MPEVEVLYFDGCPSHEQLLPTVERLAGRVGASVRLRRVETTDEAQAVGFLGSPTVRVDGVDVEPRADDRTEYGLTCRLYATPEGMSASPGEEWIVAALAAASADS